jgi:hypothetical protein
MLELRQPQLQSSACWKLNSRQSSISVKVDSVADASCQSSEDE